MKSKALVVPHHHDNLDFLKEWPSFEEEFDTIYIIYDKETSDDLKDDLGWNNLLVIAYEDRKRCLENPEDEWIFPKKDSSARSLGYYLAWKDKHDLIYTLDNDCKPAKKEDDYWIKEHEEILKGWKIMPWWPTGPEHKLRTRGLPYEKTGASGYVMLSHGTWTNNPDYDSLQMVSNQDPSAGTKDYVDMHIPRGYFFPMCGMNLAWNKEITPLLYFGLQGKDYPYTRFDDIWAGIFAKKVLDHLNMYAYTGRGIINHSRQSNKYENLVKEAPGIRDNEVLWKLVDKVTIPKRHSTPVKAYEYLIKNVNFDNLPNPEYWQQLREATLKWLELFQ